VPVATGRAACFAYLSLRPSDRLAPRVAVDAVTKRPELLIELAIVGETDADELDEATRQLRRQLLDLDVDTVELVAGDELPVGAKAAGAEILGTLAVGLAHSPALLSAVFAILVPKPRRIAPNRA
jgi:hypothetical protein